MIRLVALNEKHFDSILTVNVRGYLLDTDKQEVYKMDFDVSIFNKDTIRFTGTCLSIENGLPYAATIEFSVVYVEGIRPCLYISSLETDFKISLFQEPHRVTYEQFRS